MKKILQLLLLLSSFLFTGCIATAMLWEHTESKVKLFESSSSSRVIAEDKILAFAKSLKDTSEVQKGSLAFVGEKFFYVLDLKSSKSLYDVLNVKLEHAFEISATKELNVLDLLVLNKKREFTQNFCLLYKSKANEVEKLKDLGFVLQNDASHSIDNGKFKKCFSIKGQYFAKNNNIKIDYHFETPIKLSLYTQEYTYGSNSSNPDIVETILLTPLTLGIDAVFMVLAVPATIIGTIN